MQSSPRARTRPQRDAAMGVLATLVGLDAEAPPAPPKFADAQAFLDAVKQRYPKGTRIYEHFKIAMAAYGAGPKTTAAKELLVREVSCCFISSPDLAAAFDEFYGAALGMSAVRRPARVERATSPIQRIGAGRHEMGSRSNSPRAADGWELDAETAALCARRKQPPPASIRHLAAVENRPSKLTTAMRVALATPQGDYERPRAIAAAMAELPSCTPAAKNELFLLAAELARGARIVTARYDAPFDRDDLDLKSDERLKVTLEARTCRFQLVRAVQKLNGCDMGSLHMVCSIGHQGQPFLLFKIGGGDHKEPHSYEAASRKITLLMTRLNLQSARHVDLLAVILAVADPTCLAWRGQKNYFRPTTQYIVGAFVRLGALEPLHPNADEWLLQALHKHGGEDWDAVVRDPAFDALRRGRNVPTLKAALARLVGADLDVAKPRTAPAPPPAPLVNPAEWAQCSQCEKWRLLPKGVAAASLPDAWTCGALNVSCTKPQCSFEEDETCPCHTSTEDISVVLVTHDKKVARTYCSPNSAGIVYGLSPAATREWCLAAKATGRTATLCFAKDRRLLSNPVDADSNRVWALFETQGTAVQKWWGATVLKETGGYGDQRKYDVVYDDGSRATILANTLFAAPPPGVPIKTSKPNPKAAKLLKRLNAWHGVREKNAAKKASGPPREVRETLDRVVAHVSLEDEAPSAAAVAWKGPRAISRLGVDMVAKVVHGAARPAAKRAVPLPPAPKPHVASAASAWAAVCTDLLAAVGGSRNGIMGVRGRLVSAGFRCGNPVAGKSYYDISVPLTFPCYYDVAGKDYTSCQDMIRSKPQLTKYFQGCLALAQAGGAYRMESDREAEARRPAAKRTVASTPKPTGAIVAASFTQPAATRSKRKATPEPTPVAKVHKVTPAGV